MPSFFTELKRRNVFRVAIAYLVVAWAVVQAADIFAPAFRLPEWSVSLVLFISILAFPLVILFAWAFELTPDGLKRTEEVHPEESISNKTAVILNRVIIGLMALAIVLLLADKLLLSPVSSERTSQQELTTVETGETEAPAGESPGSTDSSTRSIAVLPFVNMSADPAQEYFSDGISEELLTRLAKIREFRVAARTSSFAFKGENRDITEIGDELNVNTILEGSVRKADNRVRITAQLVNVADGYHLWSEAYEAELDDIFAIQDEISAAIIDALRIQLTDSEPVPDSRTADIEAYDLYLLAKHHLRTRTSSSILQAREEFRRAISKDPTYAPAYAGQALATQLLSVTQYGNTLFVEAKRDAQRLLDRALELAPGLAAAHAVQGLLLLSDAGDLDTAERSLRRALAANPSEGIVYNWLSAVVSAQGNEIEAQKILQEALLVDPLHPVIRFNAARETGLAGNVAAALEMVAPGSWWAYRLAADLDQAAGRYASMRQNLLKSIEVAEPEAVTSDYLRLVMVTLVTLGQLNPDDFPLPQRMLRQLEIVIRPAECGTFLAQFELRDSTAVDAALAATCQLRMEQFGQALETLAQEFDPAGPLSTNAVSDPVSNLDYACWYAHGALKEGREAQAEALAERILDFTKKAYRNGARPGTLGRFAACAFTALGDDDAAMRSLREAWSHYQISWLAFQDPAFIQLHDREDFKALGSQVYDHMNAERAKLGWSTLELPELP